MSSQSKPKGGARPGSGRKKMPEGAKKVLIALEPHHIAKAKAIGNGNLAGGIRKALDAMPSPEAKT
jgi:hypothetical protein